MSLSDGTFIPPPGSELDDRSAELRTFVAVMTAITVISIVLRFWSRSLGQGNKSEVNKTHGRGHRFWWDDWAALAAVPFILAMNCVSFMMVDLGWGRHIWTVSPENTSTSLMMLFIMYLVNDFALFFSKASGLLFISRIFPSFTNPPWFNYMVFMIHGLNIAWLIGIIFGTVFMCTPVEKGWNPMLPGHCGETSQLWIGCAIPSVTIDLFILALPMPKVWGLHMTKGRRWSLFVVFVLGYSVIIVSLGRLITILVLGTTLNDDITWVGTSVGMWITAEAPITVLCVCLPPMLPLGRRVAKRVLSVCGIRKLESGSWKSRSGNFASASGPGGPNTSLFARERHCFHGTHNNTRPESIQSVGSDRAMVPLHVVPPQKAIRVQKDVYVS